MNKKKVLEHKIFQGLFSFQKYIFITKLLKSIFNNIALLHSPEKYCIFSNNTNIKCMIRFFFILIFFISMGSLVE